MKKFHVWGGRGGGNFSPPVMGEWSVGEEHFFPISTQVNAERYSILISSSTVKREEAYLTMKRVDNGWSSGSASGRMSRVLRYAINIINVE